MTAKTETYSNWTYGPLAFMAHHAIPGVSRLLPRPAREKMYDFFINWEEEMLAERTYRERTWFGLNGVDQYDLVADCAFNLGKYV